MEFKTFSDFYSYYLQEHTNIACRKLNFIGTCGVISLMLLFFFTGNLRLLLVLPFVGYGFAWGGHLIFGKSRHVAFKYPVYGMIGNFRMFWDILTGKLPTF